LTVCSRRIWLRRIVDFGIDGFLSSRQSHHVPPRYGKEQQVHAGQPTRLLDQYDPGGWVVDDPGSQFWVHLRLSHSSLHGVRPSGWILKATAFISLPGPGLKRAAVMRVVRSGRAFSAQIRSGNLRVFAEKDWKLPPEACIITHVVTVGAGIP